MATIHKKRGPQRGRPNVTASETKQRKADGDRLRLALKALGEMSQAEAARRSGIPQGWLSGMIAGKRPITIEHLRALGRVGVSPEYVLGLTDTLVSPGATRERGEIELDLAAHMASFVLAATAPPNEWMRQPLLASIDGGKLLRHVGDLVRDDAGALASRLAAASEQVAELRRVYGKRPIPPVITKLLGNFTQPPSYLTATSELYQAFAQHVIDTEGSQRAKAKRHD